MSGRNTHADHSRCFPVHLVDSQGIVLGLSLAARAKAPYSHIGLRVPDAATAHQQNQQAREYAHSLCFLNLEQDMQSSNS